MLLWSLITRGCVASTLCKGELLVFIRSWRGGGVGWISVSLSLVCLDRLFNWNSYYGWYLPGLNQEFLRTNCCYLLFLGEVGCWREWVLHWENPLASNSFNWRGLLWPLLPLPRLVKPVSFCHQKGTWFFRIKEIIFALMWNWPL